MSSCSKPSVVAECSIPAYSIKAIGSRHFLVAGGGGSVKTGVRNEIEIFLLTYNQMAKDASVSGSLKAKQTGVIDTTKFANMNMDIALLGPPHTGKYLVAVGQDKYCALYESVGFCLSEGGDQDSTARLSLQFCGVCRWKTDFSTKEPYQKCVKLFHSRSAIYVATSGLDGHVRLWNVSRLLERHSKTFSDCFSGLKVDASQCDDVLQLDQLPTPLLDIDVQAESGGAHGEVNDLDVAASGKVLATIFGRSISLWSTIDGRKLTTLPTLQQIDGSDIRTLKFVNLDKSDRNEIFVCVFNQRLPRAKVVSRLALFAFEKQNGNCHLISLVKACDEAVSALAISDSGDFLAIGTMDGSVGVFDTHNLTSRLYFAKACHASFVTSVTFLPHRTYDSCEWGRISASDSNEMTKEEEVNGIPVGHAFLPGVCSAQARAAVLSLSVDNKIQVHQVSHPAKTSFSASLVRLMLSVCFLYILLWFFFV